MGKSVAEFDKRLFPVEISRIVAIGVVAETEAIGLFGLAGSKGGVTLWNLSVIEGEDSINLTKFSGNNPRFPLYSPSYQPSSSQFLFKTSIRASSGNESSSELAASYL